jgi:ribonucleoside-diphosphate reductase alpha chain
MVFDLWNRACALGQRHGFRNAQVSAIAPTGTIGILMDCDTTGIEPEFALVKKKSLIEGEELFMINQAIEPALINLGYEELQRNDILRFVSNAANHCIEGAPFLKAEHLPIFDCAQKSGRGKRFLKAHAHINMLAAVQPFISGSISKTVNLPKETTSEEIGKIYKQAWEKGLKSISIYRDQSKNTQPLTCGFDRGCAD